MVTTEPFNQENQEHYAKASNALLHKIIEEFIYEGLLQPTRDAKDDKCYRIYISLNKYYQFQAIRRIFGNFDIVGSVIKCVDDKESTATDAIEFVIDTLALTGIDSMTAAHFIKELNNTLYADTNIRVKTKKTGVLAKDIYQEPYAYVEGYMHGHPWFVINKGRIGFSAQDYARYAPEMQQEQQLQKL